MTSHSTNEELPRDLSPEERVLIQWLLEHGLDAAKAYLPLPSDLHVVSRCACGCASIGFVDLPKAALKVLSDYQFRDRLDHLCGVFVFEKAGRLAGLELWSIDGAAPASELPSIDALEPF
jgi:hypothetical protein